MPEIITDILHAHLRKSIRRLLYIDVHDDAAEIEEEVVDVCHIDWFG